MRPRHSLLAIVIVGLAATAAAAQGGITVVVTDDQGLPLPGATVTISHEVGYVKTYAQLSNVKGMVEFPVLRPGAGYAIEVSFPSFTTIRVPNLTVQSGKTVPVPVRMMSDIKETVTVIADSEVIDLDTPTSTTRFSENFIKDLPVPGRSYQNVLTLAPGVQDADGDGNVNVHGSRERDLRVTVSGVSNVDPLTGQQGNSRVNPNSIEEIQVITAGAGVEYGRAQGGFANIVQKQGSNTHEGVAELYYATSKLDGDGALNQSGLPQGGFDRYEPSLHFSGPLIRDKLWYTADIQLVDREDPVNVQLIEVRTTKSQTNDFGVTWQVSPRNKLRLQHRMEPLEETNIGVSSLIGSNSSLGRERDSTTSILTWTAPFSPKVLAESVLAWSDTTLDVFPNTEGRLNDCVAGVEFLEAAQCQNLDTGQVSGSFNQRLSDHRQRLTVNGKATVYGGRFWGMSHQFKLGVAVENERYFRDLTLKPNVAFFVVTDQGPPGQAGGGLEAFGVVIAQIFVPESDDVRATGTNWGFYAEDQFKPRQNLTVTLGARVDREEISAEGHEIFDPQAELDAFLAATRPFVDPTSDSYGPTFENLAPILLSSFTGFEELESFTSQLVGLLCDEGDLGCQQDVQRSIESEAKWPLLLERRRRKDDRTLNSTNFSPSLSVAWDPFSNGKMAFKASIGRHYNNIPLVIPLQELQPAQTDVVYRIDFTGDEAGQVQLVNNISPAINVSVVDPNLRTPYQDEFTFSFERELWTETRVGLTYINRKFRDQLQDRNINAGVGDYGMCALQQKAQDPAVVLSWGTGLVTDPHTQETYQDTDPGPGDGRLDDCVGDTISFREPGAPADELTVLHRPDQIIDLYRLNPFWGDIFMIGNFNQIDYDAWELRLDRRQYRNWELQGSYVYSKAKGDGEDFNDGFDDDPSVLLRDVSGFQAYDQRHVVKLNATMVTPWGIRLGTATSWQSGLPYSILFQQPSLDTLTPQTSSYAVPGARNRSDYPTGVRNDQRNASYWNVDLQASKEYNLGRGLNLQLTTKVLNAFNDGTYSVYNPDFKIGRQTNGNNEASRRFGRRWELGIRVAF